MQSSFIFSWVLNRTEFQVYFLFRLFRFKRYFFHPYASKYDDEPTYDD